jgi:hypothetical protein
MTQDGLKKTLFIDVQTSSTAKSYDALDGSWKKLWDAQIFRDEDVAKLTPAERYTQKAATRAEFATVVCVSMGAVMFPKEGEPLLHVRAITGTEKDILARIASAFEKFDKIVAHGAKSFDIPTLGRRYLANAMPVPKLIDVRGAKPWEINYQDTQELWRFGDSAWPSLDLLCKTLSTGNVDEPLVKAEDVPALFWKAPQAENIKTIADFSAKEVVRTSQVFVKLQEPNLSLDNFQIA